VAQLARGSVKESEIRKFLRGIMEHRGRRKNGGAEVLEGGTHGLDAKRRGVSSRGPATQTRSGGLGVKGPRWFVKRGRVSKLVRGEGRGTIEVAAA
jgi:hypothetical protein